MAFYRNFDSKDAIIRYYLQKKTDRFIRDSLIGSESGYSEEYFRKLFEHLSGARELGRLLIDTNLFDLLRMEFDRIYLGKARSEQERLRYYFIAGGICNVYHYWLSSGCRETPAELARELARILGHAREQEAAIPSDPSVP